MENNESKVVEVYIVTLKCDKCEIKSRIEGTGDSIKEQMFFFQTCPNDQWNCDGRMKEYAREVKE